jgi:hypothetical protein
MLIIFVINITAYVIQHYCWLYRASGNRFFGQFPSSVSAGKLDPLASQSRHILSEVWAAGWLRRPLGKPDSANCSVGE